MGDYENELDITLTGVGNVYYKGDPEVNQTVTGVGSVIDADGK